MKVLVLQNHLNSGPGYLEEPAAAYNVELELCMPAVYQDQALPETDIGYDGFMLMGGAMNAGEVDKHPWLEQAAELVRHFSAHDKPVLGVCLGSQIIARALGAEVKDIPAAEIGFYKLALTDAAREDQLLGNGIANPLHLAEFHHQTFAVPEGATLLMIGENCPNQAFRHGRATYAFQPHFEVTPSMATDWVEKSDEWVGKYAPDLPDNLPRLLNLHHHGSHHFCWQVGSAWFELVTERAKKA